MATPYSHLGMAEFHRLIDRTSKLSRAGNLDAEDLLTQLLCELEDRLEASGFYDPPLTTPASSQRVEFLRKG